MGISSFLFVREFPRTRSLALSFLDNVSTKNSTTTCEWGLEINILLAKVWTGLTEHLMLTYPLLQQHTDRLALKPGPPDNFCSIRVWPEQSCATLRLLVWPAAGVTSRNVVHGGQKQDGGRFFLRQFHAERFRQAQAPWFWWIVTAGGGGRGAGNEILLLELVTVWVLGFVLRRPAAAFSAHCAASSSGLEEVNIALLVSNGMSGSDVIITGSAPWSGAS